MDDIKGGGHLIVMSRKSLNCAEDIELITVTGDIRSSNYVQPTPCNRPSLSKYPNVPPPINVKHLFNHLQS